MTSPPLPPPDSTGGAAQARLLIIDDEKDFLNSLQLILELNGFSVTLCSNAEQAFTALEHNHFDLILTDIEMPVKSGLDLILTLRESMELTIPIVIMTGRAKMEYLIEAIRYGASDYISKPIVGANLISLINRQITRNKIKNCDFDLNHTISSFKKTYTFRPQDFFHTSIISFLSNEIQKNLPLSPNKLNNICLILEETISNGFIHGIWQLTETERQLNRDELVKITDKKTAMLKEAGVQAAVSVEIEYASEGTLSDERCSVFGVRCSEDSSDTPNTEHRIPKTAIFRLSVSDTGTGFNYQKYLITDKQSVDTQLSSGRGLFLIKALSDMILFHNNGAKIEILLAN